ncbi:MAG TPA: hypothetical protein VER77_01985 [Candidatus Dormibacteraeota bacterium]|nr:hypothetical protein [Candidatus Dormibacteraeota bacterium]
MTPDKSTKELRSLSVTQHLARRVWTAFTLTFIVSRATVLVTSLDWFPNLHVQLGTTHVHHLNFGIALLTMTGAYLLFVRPAGRALSAAALLYGIALGLTFDEFGMWFHLEDFYWQRASFDAVVVIAGLLGLLIVAPSLRRFRPRHWATLVGLAVIVLLFGVLILRPLWSAG